MLAGSKESVQSVIESIVRIGKEFGMKINLGKTEAMRISKNKGFVNIFLEGKPVDQVNSFKYVRNLVTWNGMYGGSCRVSWLRDLLKT